MSNIFKQHNSRFSVLNEDIEPSKPNNKVNNKNQKFNQENDNDRRKYNNFISSNNRRNRFHDNSEKSKLIPPPTVNDEKSFPELAKNTTAKPVSLTELKETQQKNKTKLHHIINYKFYLKNYLI